MPLFLSYWLPAISPKLTKTCSIIMNTPYVVPPKAMFIHPDADLATARARLQACIESSIYTGIVPVKAYSTLKINIDDVKSIKNSLSNSVNLVYAWKRSTSRILVITFGGYGGFNLPSVLINLLRFRSLSSVIKFKKKFLGIQICEVSTQPVEIQLDMRNYRLKCLEPYAARRACNKGLEPYGIRQYAPYFSERRCLVIIKEKFKTSKPLGGNV